MAEQKILTKTEVHLDFVDIIKVISSTGGKGYKSLPDYGYSSPPIKKEQNV